MTGYHRNEQPGGVMPKKILVALQPALLKKIDYIAGKEARTRSDLIREALRRYIQNFDGVRVSIVDLPPHDEVSTPRASKDD